MVNLHGVKRILLATMLLVIGIDTGYAQSRPQMQTRPEASFTTLPDGRQLIAGGKDSAGRFVAEASIVQSDGSVTAAKGVLRHPRAGHTATVLPNGQVLVTGGVGPSGRLVAVPEIYDAETQSFTELRGSHLKDRTDHTATLMTDGRVLFTGGLGPDGHVVTVTEVFDPVSGTIERVDPWLDRARFGHIAKLLPTSPVMVYGGLDSMDRPIDSAELFDPLLRRFVPLSAEEARANRAALETLAPPTLNGSIPRNGAADVPIDAVIALRFSKPLKVSSLNALTIALQGPTGKIDVRVVGAEEGLLAFVTPNAELQPGAFYTVLVAGAADSAGQAIPLTAFGFRTAVVSGVIDRGGAEGYVRRAHGERDLTRPAISQEAPVTNNQRGNAARPSEDPDQLEEWIPQPHHFKGNWRAYRQPPSFELLETPKALTGVTALSGVVLRLNGLPLSNVTLSVGSVTTTTDSKGRFILENVASGKQTLVIEGKSANRADATYGYFEALVEISAGRTNQLPFTIWLPKLDVENVIRIPSPTTEEVVVTTPRIPGFEVRIPAGVVLRDRAGRIVNEIGITAIPLDRTPFPQPHMDFPVYYTVQPGGVVIESIEGQRLKSAKVIYPNHVGATPGQIADIWLYDPFEKGWYVYGQGEVSRDGHHVVPNGDVGLFEFTGGGFGFGPGPGSRGPCPICNRSGPGNRSNTTFSGGSGAGGPSSESAGDPVSLSTGLFIFEEQDLYVPDLVPLSVVRVYRSNNPNVGIFGYGWTSPLDWYLWRESTTNQQTVILVLPDGGQVDYQLITGTGYSDGVYKHSSSAGEFYKSVLQHLSTEFAWRLTLRDGRTYTFHHQTGRLIAYADRHGNAASIARRLPGDAAILGLTGPTGRWIAFTTNADGTASQITDAAGRTWNYSYSSGRLQSVTDPEGGTRQYAYDANQRLRSITEPTSKVRVINNYDVNGRVISQQYDNNATMGFAYTLDSNGNVVQTEVTDQYSNVRRVIFNNKGLITSSIYPVGKPEQQTTTFVRDAGTGRLLSKTDPLGRQTTWSYDSMGNVASVTRLAGSPDAVTNTYTYEPFYSQLATVTDPLNHTWSYTYDSAGNLASLSDPLGHQRTFSYNSRGQVLSFTDANNHLTSFEYSGADLIAVTDAVGQVTRRFYDVSGRLSHLITPLGAVVSLQYDSLDRIKKLIDGNGESVTYNYDLAGRLTSFRDQRNNLTSYEFGELGLVTRRTDPLNKLELLEYAADGSVARITDRKGAVTGFTYDNLRRLSQIGFGASSSNPTAYTRTISYTRDSGNRVTALSDSTAGTISRTFDGLDRLTQEVSPEGTVNYTYDAAGRRATMSVAGQSSTTYGWDNANRLVQIAQGAESIGFTYDNGDRRTGATLANGVAIAYEYDNADRLVSISYSKGALSLGTVQYTYDADGRRTRSSGSVARVNLPTAITSAVYNPSNQILSLNGVAYSYDFNGNLLSDGTKSYTWNERNELAAISGGSTASYSYDAMGRRRAKIEASAQTSFVYDHVNVVKEIRTSGSVGLVSGGLDELLFRREDLRHALIDGTGHVLALADTSGTIQTDYTYEPYGETTVSGSASSNTQQYMGRERDASGLYFFRARYYDPASKRFLSEDPLGLQAGPNFYEFVMGNPVSNIDPYGLDATRLWNTDGGRSGFDGPSNGNWGGKCWSGGGHSCGGSNGGNAAPTDSGDECYMRHDNCYSSCGSDGGCLKSCDKNLVKELKGLSNDPRNWPRPPRSGTETDTRNYRDWAINYFSLNK